MSFLARLFGKGEGSEVLCPHCERAMDDGHDVEGCARKRMSRRFFLGALGGAAVAVALPVPDLKWDVVIETGPSYVVAGAGNQLVTPEEFTREMLKTLEANLRYIRECNRSFSGLMETQEFAPKRPRIGDTLTVRRPRSIGINQ